MGAVKLYHPGQMWPAVNRRLRNQLLQILKMLLQSYSVAACVVRPSVSERQQQLVNVDDRKTRE